MAPIEIEQFGDIVWLTCSCGCRFNPREIPHERRVSFGVRYIPFKCPGCKRLVSITDRPPGRFGKPPILCGIVARLIRI